MGAAEKMVRERDMLHFLLAFTADLVTFFSTVLMTPTATVCLMSCTAKWPGGQKEGKE